MVVTLSWGTRPPPDDRSTRGGRPGAARMPAPWRRTYGSISNSRRQGTSATRCAPASSTHLPSPTSPNRHRADGGRPRERRFGDERRTAEPSCCHQRRRGHASGGCGCPRGRAADARRQRDPTRSALASARYSSNRNEAAPWPRSRGSCRTSCGSGSSRCCRRWSGVSVTGSEAAPGPAGAAGDLVRVAHGDRLRASAARARLRRRLDLLPADVAWQQAGVRQRLHALLLAEPFAWLHPFTRLLVRDDRRAEIHEAFLAIGPQAGQTATSGV